MSRSSLLGVVQFQHPGAEHRVDRNGCTPWNTGDHGRKFIRVNGRIATGQRGETRAGPLVCWAEWEAPSRLIQQLDRNHPYPRAVVEPVYDGPATFDGKVQNTDPYIFGERFLYTYCKQVQPSRWNSTKLSNLSPGTLILFGSRVQRQFALDTAFVVGDYITHSRDTWSHELANVVSSVYRSVTLEPMYADPIPPDVPFRLYRGATPDQPIRGMFSFFPCMPVTEGETVGFARPTIDLEGIVNPRLTQNWKLTELDHEAIARCWTDVARQVQQQGLALGVAAEEPRTTPAGRPSSGTGPSG